MNTSESDGTNSTGTVAGGRLPCRRRPGMCGLLWLVVMMHQVHRYGFDAGLPSRQLKELKQLQNENTRLKRRVTELKLEKSILQNLASLGSAGKHL